MREDGDMRFDDVQWKSLSKVMKLVEGNGALVFNTLEQIAEYVNGRYAETGLELLEKMAKELE